METEVGSLSLVKCIVRTQHHPLSSSQVTGTGVGTGPVVLALTMRKPTTIKRSSKSAAACLFPPSGGPEDAQDDQHQ